MSIKMTTPESAGVGLPDVESLARLANAFFSALPGAGDAANRARLKKELRALAGSGDDTFAARFRCCLALVRDGAVLHVSHGAVEGRIRLEEQGAGGFGYDALFVPEGYNDSFGVLPAEVKNQLSHRARALEEMRRWLETPA